VLLEAGVRPLVIDPAGDHVSGVEVVRTRAENDLAGFVDKHRVDAVFHLAGRAEIPPSLDDPVADLEANAVTTLRILAELRRARRRPVLVHASSAVVYGRPLREPMDEEHPLRPASPYGVSKLASEQYVRLAAELHGLSTVSARVFSVYGPGQRKQVVYDLAMRLLTGKRPLHVDGRPEVARDFVFADDAARACVVLAQAAPGRGEAVNIATGRPTTLGELAHALLIALGLDTEICFSGGERPGDQIRMVGDPSRARALGIDCPTSVGDGLRATAPWLIEVARSSRGG
jgi:UDP-glucose 4-epimerase